MMKANGRKPLFRFTLQPSVGSLAHTVMFELKYYIEQADMTGKEPGRGASA
jgi:hypothetical protein